MKEFITEFINYLSVERGLANNTLLAYRRDLEKYSEFLEKAGVGGVNQVTRDRVTNFMHTQKQSGLSVTSICRSLAAIKMFHRFLMRERLGGTSSIGSYKSVYYMIKVSLAIFFIYLRLKFNGKRSAV